MKERDPFEIGFGILIAAIGIGYAISLVIEALNK